MKKGAHFERPSCFPCIRISLVELRAYIHQDILERIRAGYPVCIHERDVQVGDLHEPVAP